jgi:hypothetical protein
LSSAETWNSNSAPLRVGASILQGHSGVTRPDNDRTADRATRFPSAVGMGSRPRRVARQLQSWPMSDHSVGATESGALARAPDRVGSSGQGAQSAGLPSFPDRCQSGRTGRSRKPSWVIPPRYHQCANVADFLGVRPPPMPSRTLPYRFVISTIGPKICPT